ncbi:hypothetical protein GCM10023168_35450 [Fodinibacter luteus]|uniref:Uncharacterized protein n=1 Tax=Fodinibacter luteus TaxID=552064 RepID=A0ABP8KQW0_9MICO
MFNLIEERRGARPVLIHTGRISGKTYRTPLDAHRLPDGTCSSRCTAHAPTELRAPRLIRKDDIWPLLPATTRVPPSITGDSQLLRMDIHEPASQP